jgi:CRISPR-associated protein Cas2
MAQQKLWYLVAYDVREPKRLRRVAKHLKGYGARVQYSIFRCRLSKRELERLQWELKKIMKDEDDLLVIGLCATCVARIARKNKDEQWPQTLETFKII